MEVQKVSPVQGRLDLFMKGSIKKLCGDFSCCHEVRTFKTPLPAKGTHDSLDIKRPPLCRGSRSEPRIPRSINIKRPPCVKGAPA